MSKNEKKLLYRDGDIEVSMIMDDQDERPLTYWYAVKDFKRDKFADGIDIRKLNAFTENGKPSHIQLVLHRAEIVPAIFRKALNDNEIV